jgi:hypothetical protein
MHQCGIKAPFGGADKDTSRVSAQRRDDGNASEQTSTTAEGCSGQATLRREQREKMSEINEH